MSTGNAAEKPGNNRKMTGGRVHNWEQIPSEPVRAGLSRKGYKWQNMMMVMNECHPGMKLNPHSHTFEQLAYIVSGRAIYHIDAIGHQVGPGSLLVIPAFAVHYIEPVGTEPVMNLDFFEPAREDYMHLVKYLEEEPQSEQES